MSAALPTAGTGLVGVIVRAGMAVTPGRGGAGLAPFRETPRRLVFLARPLGRCACEPPTRPCGGWGWRFMQAVPEGNAGCRVWYPAFPC